MRNKAATTNTVSFKPRIFLTLVIICAVLVASLLGMGKVLWAGICFWLVLGLMLARVALSGRSEEILCLLIAMAPFINLLRAFAFYNVVGVLFGGALAYHFFRAPEACRTVLRKYPLLKGIFIYVTLYYLVSLFNTHEYAVNLRLFELAFAALAVVMIGRDRALLGTALVGTILCAWAVGISMLSHVHSDTVARLGIIVIDGYTLGNPTQLGIPLAFGSLALIIDRGRWLNLESQGLRRLLMLLPTLPLLALTTSRASWLVAVGGVLTNLAFGKKQQFKMLLVIGLGALAIQAVLISPYGNSLKKGLDRTFGGSRTSAQRTSGRSDQWLVAGHAVTQSINTIILGHGPGRGPEVYAKFSTEMEGIKYAVGKKVALHSLFMQIAVEAGLLGLLTLAVWLLVCGVKIFKRLRRTHEIFPLICLLGYVFIVITVSGNDINSGIFLGIALLGTAQLRCPRFSVSRPPDRLKAGHRTRFAQHALRLSGNRIGVKHHGLAG